MRRRNLPRTLVIPALLAIICLASACSGDDKAPGSGGKGTEKESAGTNEEQVQGADTPAVVQPVREGPAGGSTMSPSSAPTGSTPADLEAIRANLGGDPEMNPLPVPAERSKPIRPVKAEITLSHMLDRVWGVRLPSSSAGYALEARIGSPPYTLSFSGMPDPELPELFPRELVVVVSKEEMIVNDVKVADVVERSRGDGAGQTWEVPKGEGSFRIQALTAQLQQYIGYRSTLLRAAGIPPELTEACDLATLVMDEALPFRFLAEVVLSAGHADIFRFRLATRSLDGLISYQVITAPRLDRKLVEATHLLGDEWWTALPAQARDFEFAYVNYIATANPDLWNGECEQEIGVCISPDITGWDDLVDRQRRQEITMTLDQIRAGARQTACGEARDEPSSAEAESATELNPETGAVDSEEAGAVEAAPPPVVTAATERGVVSIESDEAVPAGTLVVAPPVGPGARVPFIYLRQDGAYLVLYDMDRMEAVRSELFGAEKLDLMVSTLKEIHPDSGVLHLGADLEVPIARLVEVADLLRHRCRIQSMSGRCIEQERWLASVVLFTSPPERFGLMPEPAPGAVVVPFHPVMGEPGKVPPAGVCPLRDLQDAAAARLEGIRTCLEATKSVQNVTLSIQWHPDGRLEVVATDPPLAKEPVRCIKTAFSAPAPPRETGCAAALLIKATPPPAG